MTIWKKSLAAAAVLTVASAAQADTKWGGDLRTSWDFGIKPTKSADFGVSRAVVWGSHEFNSDWGVNVAIDGADSGNLRHGYVWGNVGLGTMTFGKQYYGIYKHLSGVVKSNYLADPMVKSVLGSDRFEGLSYALKLGGMAHADLYVKDGTNPKKVGYGVHAGASFAEMLGVHAYFDSNSDLSSTIFNFGGGLGVNHDMVDLLAEVGVTKVKGVSGNTVGFGAQAGLKFHEVVGLWTMVATGNDAYKASNGTDFAIGPTAKLTDNLRTAIAYWMNKPKVGDSSQALSWRWEATF